MDRQGMTRFGSTNIDPQRFDKLSVREAQVLSLSAAGYLDKQICAELGLSPNTLRTFWTRIRAKVGSAPRSALAAAFVQRESANTIELEPDFEIDLSTRKYKQLSDRTPFGEFVTGKELTIDEVLEMAHPDDRSQLEDLAYSLSPDVDDFAYAARFIFPEGMVIGSATVHVIRDENGKAVKMLGRRMPHFDARGPAISDVQVGHWTRDIGSSDLKGDEAFCKIFRVDPGKPNLREQVLGRLDPSTPVENMVEESAAAGLDHVRRTHRLMFDDGTDTWVTTDFHIEKEDGKPMRAVGVVMAFH